MDFLHELRLQLNAVRECLEGDLAAPIEHCPGWTLYDLARHMGNGNLWVATAVREKRDDHPAQAPPRDRVVEWYQGTSDAMLEALSGDPDAAAWTIFPPHTVGFWRRRRTHETVIHRWDAEHALGRVSPLSAALAHDGIAEVFDTMAPRQV
ncbi:MAG: maleylpyruvate isomerase family mycothiol-dependent enzyme, partial [Nonomuraea sp.]|nr:maleylpyruvate isomerase family mycothiol-dependent enzyme [Nonomuraea sp.]